jgi:hypothetical protein
MKVWKCPKCKRVSKYECYLISKVCYVCQVEMEVVEYE